MEMIPLLIGAFLSFIITSHYHQRSSCETPKWAENFIKKLPKEKPSKRELIKLFQEYLDDGEAVIHEVTGHVACPECGEPASSFEDKVHTVNDYVSVAEVRCPQCGWKTYGEV